MINILPTSLLIIIYNFYSDNSYKLLIFLKINKSIRKSIIDVYDPNKYDRYGRTPLSIVCNKDILNKNYNNFKLLLSLPKINVNRIVDFNKTILIKLCNNKNKSSLIKLKLLLKHKKLDINYKLKNKYKTNGLSALINASYFKINILKELLKHPNINVNISFKSNSALHFAIYHNCINNAKLLLNNPNININKKGLKGNTPLHAAIIKSKYNNSFTTIVSRLLNINNIKINQHNYYGFSPLHLAVEFNNIKIVKMLMNNEKININIKTHGYTGLTIISALSIAFHNGFYKIIKYLINNNVSINKNDESLFCNYLLKTEKELDSDLSNNKISFKKYKINLNKIKCKKFLIFNILNKEFYPLIYYVNNSNINLTSFKKILGNKNINEVLKKNKNFISAMDIIIKKLKYNNRNILLLFKFIVNHKDFDINKIWNFINSNIDIINKNNSIILDEILKHKDIDPHKCIILRKNMDSDKMYLIKKIIKNNNFNINYIDNEGNSFLHICCMNNNFESLKLFINEDIKLNIKNNKNETALDIAYKNKNLSMISYLYLKNAIILLKDINFFRCNRKRKR
jgi:ankyrin repeat protein